MRVEGDVVVLRESVELPVGEVTAKLHRGMNGIPLAHYEELLPTIGLIEESVSRGGKEEDTPLKADKIKS